MKFIEIKKEEALNYINDKQYETLIQWTACHDTKYELWINTIEKYGLNPLEITLPVFYS
jgi:hypothetical protein